MPITVEFSHSAPVRVAETTYLRPLFMALVIGSAGSADGQNAANSSYVTRPSRVASLPPISAPTAAPIWSSKYGKCQV